VAATRARRNLHLLGNVEVRDSPDGRTLIPPRTGSMLSMLWNELRPTYEEALSASPETNAPTSVETSNVLRRFPINWRPPAADPAFTPKTATVGAIVSTDRPEFDWVSETGRRVGTLVHRELERMTRNRQAPPMALEIIAARPRLVAELVELGVPPDRCNTAIDRVITAIQNTLDDARGRWLLGIDQRISETESELALSGIVDGVVIEGVIDRTFVDSDGTRWIVDFKTSTHEGSGLEKFLAQEVERYRPQLARYAQLMRLYKPDRPVKAALYFPLLRTWRKVAV
jgi:ATP-dependent exoDNAse (exonuclease V) beta subunit